MRCGPPPSVQTILVGLQQVGITGLGDAFRAADATRGGDDTRTLDFLMARLSERNYLPDSQVDLYRRAVWREYLRYRGEDFRDFYSTIEVVVAGHPGDEREQFVATLYSVLSDFELRPSITFAPAADDPAPQLLIGDRVVVRGRPPREDFKTAVGKSISHW